MTRPPYLRFRFLAFVVGGLVVAVVAAIGIRILFSDPNHGSAGGSSRAAGGQDADQATPAMRPGGITVSRFQYPTLHGHDSAQNWADLYLPAGVADGHRAPGSVPLVVLIHGGSWQSHISASSFDRFAQRLAGRDMAVYNVEYRRLGSGGGWPVTFSDVAGAMDFVPDIAHRYPQLDVENSVVVGHSAGAQLATWASTRRSSEPGIDEGTPRFRPNELISLAGPLDMREAVALGDYRVIRVLGGTPEQVGERYRLVDPIENLDPQLPVVAVAGTADTIVPPVLSERYVAAVHAAGGNARLVLIPGATHTSIVSPTSKAFITVIELISRAAHDAHNDQTGVTRTQKESQPRP
ncbi:alpha/beta fold hydrolase [Gordonia jinhuaensis]|uniref:Esterase n=1 Tax=Gordonia jinhuaensis TaxID=1517702 RepID=A0A916TF23_9ACTN|nr:alpha/beta hydrolase fold domain-containing protein [Gordonia jinhuaensis]GGB42510.1 esterase [Gordonia jinhuaensis]